MPFLIFGRHHPTRFMCVAHFWGVHVAFVDPDGQAKQLGVQQGHWTSYNTHMQLTWMCSKVFPVITFLLESVQKHVQAVFEGDKLLSIAGERLLKSLECKLQSQMFDWPFVSSSCTNSPARCWRSIKFIEVFISLPYFVMLDALLSWLWPTCPWHIVIFVWTRLGLKPRLIVSFDPKRLRDSREPQGGVGEEVALSSVTWWKFPYFSLLPGSC